MTDDQSVSKGTSESSSDTVDVVADDAETLRQEIQRRAYHRYCERGCGPGADMDDWLAAEQEVLAKHPTSVAAPVNTPADDSNLRRRRQGREPR
jgi:hypothetical protein